MKLRIRGNSVRIRLTRSEVDRLGSGERVEQTTQFSMVASLKSSVESTPRVAAPLVEFAGSTLCVLLPTDQVRRWATSDQVTIDATQDAGAGALLQILVEKDFECIHSRAEGNTDAYPNPNERQSFAGGTASCSVG